MENTIIKVMIDSQLNNLPLLRKAIRGICSFIIEEDKVLQDIDLCLNEALSNIIFHAYKNEPGKEIQIAVTIKNEEFLFELIDSGLSRKNHPPPSPLDFDMDNLDNLSESGRGIFIIHQLMDEVEYRQEGDKNILLMRKRFKT